MELIADELSVRIMANCGGPSRDLQEETGSELNLDSASDLDVPTLCTTPQTESCVDPSVQMKLTTIPSTAEIIEKGCSKEQFGDLDRLRLIFRDSASFASNANSPGTFIRGIVNNYVRKCIWNHSGEYVVAFSQDQNIRMFEFIEASDESVLVLRATTRSLSTIFDFCVHPIENLFAVAVRDIPINIYDINCLPVRVYPAIRQKKEDLDTPYSVKYSLKGQSLYAGYRDIIRCFDVETGQYVEQAIWSKEMGGQRGIVSCLAMNPVRESAYAAGTSGDKIAVYSVESQSAELSFDGPSNGVTDMHFSSDGLKIFTSNRMSNEIHCYDLRSTTISLHTFMRPALTNQRYFLSFDREEKYLFSGSSDGCVYIFDLSDVKGGEQQGIEPVCKVHASSSSIPGISVHPTKRSFVTCSGQRIFPFPRFDGSSDSSEEDEVPYERRYPHQVENHLHLWAY